MSKRPPKKTESIEIRISPELKAALGDLSKGRGQSMSEAVRDMLTREIAAPSPSDDGASKMRLHFRFPVKLTAAALSVAALGMAYAMVSQVPATASSAEMRLLFAEYDLDGDNAVSPEEFAAFVALEEAEERAHWAEEREEIEPFPAVCAGTELEVEYLEEHGEPEPTDPAEEFRHLDSDGNGALAFAEIEAAMLAERAREFLEYDEDGNGFVTLSDLTDHRMMPSDLTDMATELAEEGFPQPCIDHLIAEETAAMAEEAEEDPTREARLLIAEFDHNRDGRVALMEFIHH